MTPDRRIRRAWWIFAGSFFVLGLIAVLRVADRRRAADGLGGRRARARRRRRGDPPSRGGRRAGGRRGARRPNRSRGSCRACRARSRPTRSSARSSTSSPSATGADHIVVARRRPDARVLEATLVSARPGVPDSTTLLPIADLEDPVGGDAVADREPVAVPIVVGVAGPVAAGGLRGRLDDWTARLAAATPVTGTSGPLAVAARVPRERQLVADRIAARARAGLRPDRHAGRAADRRTTGVDRRDRPVAPDRAAPGRRPTGGC